MLICAHIYNSVHYTIFEFVDKGFDDTCSTSHATPQQSMNRTTVFPHTHLPTSVLNTVTT